MSYMQRIYTYIPETNHIPKEYNVVAILSLLFMVPISLAPALAVMYFYISTFRSMCAVHNMAVFCSSLTSWFPGMVLTYFLNDFDMVPVAPITLVNKILSHERFIVFLTYLFTLNPNMQSKFFHYPHFFTMAFFYY
jgi:hypothetical protein